MNISDIEKNYYREKLSLERDTGLEVAREGKGMLLFFVRLFWVFWPLSSLIEPALEDLVLHGLASPAVEGKVLATGPPGKSPCCCFKQKVSVMLGCGGGEVLVRAFQAEKMLSGNAETRPGGRNALHRVE